MIIEVKDLKSIGLTFGDCLEYAKFMRVEVDQSGKLEQLDTDTVIAFANGQKDLVVINAGVKRELIQYLKGKVYSNKDFVPLLFAVGIYILVKNLPKQVVLEIDEEYSGYDELIRRVLRKLLNKKFNGKWDGSIRFVRIGKESPAHLLAWTVHKLKKRPGYKKLSFEEIASLM